MSKEDHSLFADTSNIPEIDELMALGLFTGITTNPLIVAKQAVDAKPSDYYKKLQQRYPNLPISIQLLDEPLEDLLEHAREHASLGPNIVVKVPMFPDRRGLDLLPRLIDENIKTNVTALMSAEQMLAVLNAGEGQGPTYASLFFNRIKDGSGNPVLEIDRSRQLIDKIGSPTKIITGSIRNPKDVFDAFQAGAHILTVPPAIVRQMDIQDAYNTSYVPTKTSPVTREQIEHPESVRFISESQEAWEDYLKLR